MSDAAILMPKLGLTMTEGLIASWRVKAGDVIADGDVLFVVETEKIATDIEAQGSGRIEAILIPEGATAPVGSVVATWTGGGNQPALPGPRAADVAAPARTSETGQNGPFATESDRAVSDARRLIATPLARKLARQASVDLETVTGSGPRGRIKARDIETAVAAQRRESRNPEPAFGPPPAEQLLSSRPTRRPATAIEKVVARRLTAAKQAIPHFYVQAQADVTRLLALRDELNATDEHERVSLTHFLVAALGRALVQTPEVNVLWDNEDVVQLATGDVGVAVNTDRGLLVPVLRGADRLSLDGIASAVRGLAAKARDGRLETGDLDGGAISISNVGMFGASYLTPIINPGQSAILGVASVQPVFRPDPDGQPLLREELGLVLSCDHRVLDGVKAARFLDLVVQLLQRPLSLLRG